MNSSVKSARRVLDILEFITTSDHAVSLRHVTEALAIPKSSAHMLLATLIGRGYLERSNDGLFSLASEVSSSVGWMGGLTLRLKSAANPVLDKLVANFEETIVVGVPTPTLDVRVLCYRTSPLVIRYDVSTTPLFPAYCSAMGLVILAHQDDDTIADYLARTELKPLTPRSMTTPEALMRRLRQVRARGYALNIDERLIGASGAAFPVFAQGRRIVGALLIASVTPRFLQKRGAIIAALAEASSEISREAFGIEPVKALAAGGS